MSNPLRLPLHLSLLLSFARCTPASAPMPADLSVAEAAPPDMVHGMSGVRGIVRDEEEAPLADVPVLSCTVKSCVYGKSDLDGTFFVQVPDDARSLVVKTPEDIYKLPRRGESVRPVLLPGFAIVDVGALYVPTLPAGTNLGPAASDPQTVTVGDGLVLTLRRADLTPPLGAMDTQIAARQIPLKHVPLVADLDPAKLVAVYALEPFSMASTSKIAVRAPTTLPAGTPVSFRTVSEIDGKLSAPEPGSSDGTYVSTSAGAGIADLTWLMISK